jgi:hypothetical protein
VIRHTGTMAKRAAGIEFPPDFPTELEHSVAAFPPMLKASMAKNDSILTFTLYPVNVLWSSNHCAIIRTSLRREHLVRDEGVRRFKSCHSDQHLACKLECHPDSFPDRKLNLPMETRRSWGVPGWKKSRQTEPNVHHSEQVAKTIIEDQRQGSQMRFCVHQSKGECDFELLSADGAAVAEVEVTMLTDEAMKRTLARIANSKEGGQFVDGQKCQKGWSVVLRQGADDIRKVRALIDSYLAPIEASGTEQFHYYMDAATSPAISNIFRDLGIEWGCVTKWTPPENRICINGPAYGGRVETTAALGPITAEADKPDNIKKLGAVSQQLERHLFVYVDPRCYLAWKSLVDAPAPLSEIAELPKEITHIWAVSETCRSPGEFAIWTAHRGRPWQASRITATAP